MAGGVSLEDWSRRTETVSPQRDEHCGCQSELDSAVSVKSDGNDIELNGETDDEDMEDEETRFANGSAQVRNIRDPGQTANENKEHITTHRPYRSWCTFSVTGRGVNSPHRRSDAQEDWEGVPHLSMDYGFLGERESEEQVNPMVVSRERRHKITWAMLVPRKGTEFPWLAKRAAEFIEQIGHNRVTLRCDNEPALEAWARQIAQARQEGRQAVLESPPVGESQSNGIIERTVGLVAGQARTLWGALERQRPGGCEDTVLVGGVCRVPDEHV